MEQVGEAIRSGDRELMLKLRDRLRAPDLFTADAAMHTTLALGRLEAALTAAPPLSLSDGRHPPQAASERPLSERLSDVRRALTGDGDAHQVNARKRAAVVKQSMNGTAS